MTTPQGSKAAAKTCRTALPDVAAILLLVTALITTSCSKAPTDMRSLAPSESLVYIESNDLAAAIRPLVESPTYIDAAKGKPNLSALEGVQMAVAVTGFQAKEERVTDEHSIGSVQPRFVAIVDTHAWNWQAVSFAKNQLNSFVNDVYRGETKLEQYDKFGGTYLTWTSGDGRTVHALVLDSLIYFANDETAIEKCVSVKKGESESIAGKIPPSQPGFIGRGFVSEEGAGQIANILSLQTATEASEESEVQSAIAGLLPGLVRGNITGVKWTASSNGTGYVDTYTFGLAPDVTAAFAETMAASTEVDAGLSALVPAAAPSVTLYNLKDPALAWRSLLLIAQAKADPLGARVITELSGAFGEPYGIADPQMFLAGTGKNVISLRLDPEGDRPVLIGSAANRQVVEASLSKELKPDAKLSAETGAEVFSSAESDIACAFSNGYLITGDRSATLAVLGAKGRPNPILRNGGGPFGPGFASTTLSLDTETSVLVADLLSERKGEAPPQPAYTVTKTRFTRDGLERVETSDLGLIGWIVAQLAAT